MDSSKNGAYKNQHQKSHQRETMHDEFVFYAKCIYVSEIRAEGILCLFTRKCEK